MIAAPEKPPAPKTRPQLDWRRDDTRTRTATWIGVIGTILIHLLFFWLAPHIHRELPSGLVPPESPPEPTYEIELAPVEEPPPEKFVEANPTVPDNKPDKTDNVAAQNQQVANPEPGAEDKTDAPKSKGDPDKNSTAIVSGQLVEPTPTTNAPPPAPETTLTIPEKLARPQREQTPLAGHEKIEGEDPAGIGENIGKLPPKTDAAPTRVEGEQDGDENSPVVGQYYQVDAKNPRPRPTLSPRTTRARPAPLMNNEVGSKNIGAAAYSAKWSSYAEYLQKLIDTVQVQWERINDQTRTYPSAGTQVRVVFRINKEGEIYEITKADGSASQNAVAACIGAITDRAPYGEWPQEMINVLGESQEITFTFYYY